MGDTFAVDVSANQTNEPKFFYSLSSLPHQLLLQRCGVELVTLRFRGILVLHVDSSGDGCWPVRRLSTSQMSAAGFSSLWVSLAGNIIYKG